MMNDAGGLKRGECLLPTDFKLLANPLDFIHEDHLRERSICSEIDTLAQSETLDPNIAHQILAFLKHELPLHLEDEEQDLFPLLRRRCEAEDEIDKAIQRLRSDHRHAVAASSEVLDILEKVLSGKSPISAEESRMLIRYASHARRHLILENAIVLPLAKLRLTEGDLESLRLRMMQRRGLDRLKEAEDAE